MSLYDEWKELCTLYEFPHSHFYESDLKEILKMYHFLKEQYGNLLKTIDEINIRMDNIDEQIAKDIEKALIPYTQKINETVNAINLEMDRLRNQVDNSINNMNLKISTEILKEKTERIESDLANKELIEDYVSTLELQINELEELIIKSGIAIINPRNSKLDTIQNVANDLYLATLECGAFTSSELSVYPTCDDIRKGNLTYNEFTVNSRRLKENLINNVVTGNKGDINYALSSLKSYNNILALTNEEIAKADEITNDIIANWLVNYTQFITRSKLLSDEEVKSLGMIENGKELFMVTREFANQSSSAIVNAFSDLDIDRIYNFYIIRVSNDAEFVDMTTGSNIQTSGLVQLSQQAQTQFTYIITMFFTKN